LRSLPTGTHGEPAPLDTDTEVSRRKKLTEGGETLDGAGN